VTHGICDVITISARSGLVVKEAFVDFIQIFSAFKIAFGKGLTTPNHFSCYNASISSLDIICNKVVQAMN
jgi:hypothetical protein